MLEFNSIISDYIVREMLGIGAFGEVYAAEN
jgi:hypothetical protein